MTLKIKVIQSKDRPFISEIVKKLWGDEIIIVHGEIFQTSTLDGLKALLNDQIIGFLHYQCRTDECEIITLASLVEGQGVGSALIEVIERITLENGCRKLSVITTNDNLHALGFYQRRGFHLAALFSGSINSSRKIKPAIPAIGENNIPIRDELCLEKTLLKDAFRT